MPKTKEELAEISKATQFRAGKEQVEIARKAGIESGKARREKKIIKEEILKRMTEDDWEKIIAGVISRASESDKGFETFQASIGQKPKEEIVAETDNKIEITLGSELNEWAK